MKFNALKCKVLTITRKKSPVTTDYHLGDANLQRVEQEKDLGIMINLSDQRVMINELPTYPGTLIPFQLSTKPTRCLVS
jgi:hypothetical protein